MTGTKQNLSRRSAAAKTRKQNKWIQAIVLAVFFIVWQLVTIANVREGWFNPVFLPAPTTIVATAASYLAQGKLLGHIGISLYRLLTGFAIGTLLAVVLGSLMALFRKVNNLLSPIINLFGPIPVLAFLPMFLIWFGIGENSKITLIAYTTVIAMLPYVLDGIRGTDSLLVRSALSLGASGFQVFWHVLAPAALSNIFSGMKACLGLAFSSLVVAEMMGASSGLGFIIVDSKNWFKLADMFMSAIIIGLLYTGFFAVLTAAERLLFRWKKSGLDSAVEN
ncbi:MAG: ABC transporter permease [Intestinibacillus sp.]